MELLMEHVGKGFIDTLLLSMPIVLVAAGIGLVVGILQAVTQVQEQTIAAAPKIVGVFLAIMILSGFFMKSTTEYLEDSFYLAFKVVTKQDDFVLPSSGWYDGEGKDFSHLKRPDIKQMMNSKVPYAEKLPQEQYIKTNQVVPAQPNVVEAKKIYSRK